MGSRALVLFVFVMLGACSSTIKLDVTKQPALADYKDGEKWVWKYKGVTSEGVVRAEGKDTKEIVSRNGKLDMVTGTGTIPLVDIVKPVENKTPRYNWPLEVGKKWKFEESWTSEDGTKGMTSQDAEIISFKEETVEAGTFMAFTIRYKGKITNSRGYSADTEDVHWYAPELKTFIKLTQSQGDYLYIEELVEYSKN